MARPSTRGHLNVFLASDKGKFPVKNLAHTTTCVSHLLLCLTYTYIVEEAILNYTALD